MAQSETKKKERRGRKKSTRSKIRSKALELKIENYLEIEVYITDLYKLCTTEKVVTNWSDLATELGISTKNTLFLIAQKQRRLTEQMAQKICEGLGFQGLRKSYFLALAEYAASMGDENRKKSFKKVLNQKTKFLKSSNSKKPVIFYSDWIIPIVREIVFSLKDQATVENIKKSLNIDVKTPEINRALKTLLQLEYVRYDEKTNTYSADNVQIFPDKDTLNLIAESYHLKMCELETVAMKDIPSKKQENNSITVSVSLDTFKEIKALLNQVSSKIIQMDSESKEKEIVVQVGLRAFEVASCVDVIAKKQEG